MCKTDWNDTAFVGFLNGFISLVRKTVLKIQDRNLLRLWLVIILWLKTTCIFGFHIENVSIECAFVYKMGYVDWVWVNVWVKSDSEK